MSRQFVVALEPEDFEALEKVATLARSVERAWLKEARDKEGISFLRGKAASQARARVRARLAGMRQAGKLAGTRDLVLARAIRAELKARKMLGEYPPVPTEHVGAPGRPVGAGPQHYGRGEEDPTTLTARLAVRLPDDLGEQLVRAVHWKNASVVEALWEWQERWGDGPEVVMREASRNGMGGSLLAFLVASMASRPDPDSILQRAELQAQIITTGDIIRSAVHRLL
ncbi:hypothetical protein [Streptomyces sp. NPDC020983]|uniref:hypothetical protein n=1 Tax=Streptomyces sp. NPDC020983 TaxID=3365106 RepID=UPI0037B56806